MPIKTFPLVFEEKDLERIGKAADALNMSKKKFIHMAVEQLCQKTEKQLEKRDK